VVHRRLWQLAARVPWYLVGAVGLGVLLSAAAVTQALVVARAVNDLFAGDIDGAAWALALAAVLVAARSVLQWLRHVATAWIEGKVRQRVRDELFARLAELGPGSGASRTGVVQSAVTDGVASLAVYYSRYLPQLAIAMVVPFVILVGVIQIHLLAGLVLTIGVVAALVVPRIKDRQLVAVGRLRWNDHLELSADYLQAMQSMTTLRALGAAERTGQRLERSSLGLYVSTMRELRISLLENGVTAFVVQGASVAAVVAAAGAAGPVEVSTVVLVLLLGTEAFRPIRDLTAAWHAGYLGVTAIDGVDAILGAAAPVRDTGTRTAPWATGAAAPPMRLDGVVVRYPGADRQALRGVSLTVQAGSLTAVVGPSGAGKSTIAEVMMRLRDPDLGSVSIGGTDLREVPLASLRSSRLSLVEQHPFLLAGTVRANVTIADPDVVDEDVWAALREATADEFVAALPDALDTDLEEGAANLSGGQQQRLALARALLARPQVLVLDEATSHLDEASSARVLSALAARRGRCTTVVVAHRMSLALACDEVVVVEDGRVVQHGPPDRLREEPGLFATLCQTQTVGS
jgi:ATP-binding cassette, subfamily C, bacterial CydD